MSFVGEAKLTVRTNSGKKPLELARCLGRVHRRAKKERRDQENGPLRRGDRRRGSEEPWTTSGCCAIHRAWRPGCPEVHIHLTEMGKGHSAQDSAQATHPGPPCDERGSRRVASLTVFRGYTRVQEGTVFSEYRKPGNVHPGDVTGGYRRVHFFQNMLFFHVVQNMLRSWFIEVIQRFFECCCFGHPFWPRVTR